MKRISLVFITLISAFSAKAQFDFDTDKFIDGLVGDVRSDRPGNAISAQTCGFLTLQLQTGFQFEKLDLNSGFINWNHVPTDFKVGLSNNLELNTSFTYTRTVEYSEFSDSTYISSGVPGPYLGMRYSFLKGQNWIPTLALQASIKFKSEQFFQDKLGSTFLLATINNFGRFSVNSNIGVSFQGDGSNSPSIPYVLNTTYSFGKLSIYIEGFGDLQTPSLNGDAGFALAIGNDFVLDAFGGWLGGTNENWWFAQAGFTYRFSFLRMMAKKKAGQIFNK